MHERASEFGWVQKQTVAYLLQSQRSLAGSNLTDCFIAYRAARQSRVLTDRYFGWEFSREPMADAVPTRLHTEIFDMPITL